MAITDDEYERWLRDDNAVRTVLLDIRQALSGAVRRVSVLPYTTPESLSTEFRASYDAIVRGSVQFTESLALSSGQASSSWASVDLHNEDGALDFWIDLPVADQDVVVRYGDVRWRYEDFRVVARGGIRRVEPRRQRLSVLMLDRLQHLAQQYTDVPTGGTGPDAERLTPAVLGECHNITPRLHSPATHEYRFCSPAVQYEQIIEVRDRGVPVQWTAVPGGFRLRYGPDQQGRQITASVQGHADAGGYHHRVAPLVRLLATRYGPGRSLLTDTDLDMAGFAAFDEAHSQPVGIYLAEQMTVLSAIVDVASAVGAQPVMGRDSVLRLAKVQLPPPGQAPVPGLLEVGPADYEAGTLDVVQQIHGPVPPAVAYCRNWTPGADIAEIVPEAHRSLYAREWIETPQQSSTQAGGMGVEVGSPDRTLLLREADALAEAVRRFALWGRPRIVVRVQGFAWLLGAVALGQQVILRGDRFGLDAPSGRQGQVVGIRSDWVAGRCQVDILM